MSRVTIFGTSGIFFRNVLF